MLSQGFFTYKNDTQEQDIEFVSADPEYFQTVHYTNQPGQLPNTDPDPAAHKVLSCLSFLFMMN